MKPPVTALIAAGGMGVRMRAPLPKQLLILGGMPLLTRALLAFERHADVDDIVLALPESAADEILKTAAAPFGFTKIRAVVAGGESRQASVYAGLAAIHAGVVLIHDGARPFVSERDISGVIAVARGGGCAVLGARATDTVKTADDGGFVEATLPRGRTWLAQTPQGFPYEIIMDAHRRAALEGFAGTDDSVLVERLGIRVVMVEGGHYNMKVTEPGDMPLAERLAEGGF
jgi:2-C-methyl-D-erythritol 4-phosphate cytidylyltransferase